MDGFCLSVCNRGIIALHNEIKGRRIPCCRMKVKELSVYDTQCS